MGEATPLTPPEERRSGQTEALYTSRPNRFSPGVVA